MIAAELDPSWFSDEFWMVARHLTVEQERNIGVEFFLDLMEPDIRGFPRSRLIHREEDFTGFLIDAEQIDNRGIGNAG
jgi:hypothetical protein